MRGESSSRGEVFGCPIDGLLASFWSFWMVSFWFGLSFLLVPFGILLAFGESFGRSS